MKGGAFYNDTDPYAAAWLRNLIAAGHLPAGVVEERSIADLTRADLDGYTEAHFFAGIGGWPLALRLAGWPAGRPVWTGSCPCQPISCAGKRKGADDERHLWPVFFNLIRELRPSECFGEQVASADGIVWLDAVRADLEAEGYAFGASDLPACSVGAPHKRQRVFWVADGSSARLEGRTSEPGNAREERSTAERDCDARGLADNNDDGREGQSPSRLRVREPGDGADGRGASRGLEHPLRDSGGRHPAAAAAAQAASPGEGPQARRLGHGLVAPGTTGGFWADAEWLPCSDGKWRPVEPGTFPLASRVPNRVGKLRAYGNAIVPQTAAIFVRAYMEARAIPPAPAKPAQRQEDEHA